MSKNESEDESMDASSMSEDDLPTTSDQFGISFESSDEKAAWVVGNFTVRGRGQNQKHGFWAQLCRLFTRHNEPRSRGTIISIPEFFASVKNSIQDLEVINSRASGYSIAMEQAGQAGQTALLEKLKKGLMTYRNETQLVAINSRKYITEDDLVRFVKQAKKGLRLDWVGNFIRMIPSDILNRKIKMDDLGIFDNYVVLHYDPDKKSWAETKAEIAARRDPILFGLMSGSRNLYFVGDWIDEKCDLTLEQIVDQLGSSIIQEIK
ncbi:MAG: hypothetical protein WC708_00070 [Lentisphaeria bacterium]|jgi:hypothetical protein